MVLGNGVWSVFKIWIVWVNVSYDPFFEQIYTIEYQIIQIFGSKILKKNQIIFNFKFPRNFFLIAILKFDGKASQ